MKYRVSTVLGSVTALTLSACGDDPEPASVDDIAQSDVTQGDADESDTTSENDVSTAEDIDEATDLVAPEDVEDTPDVVADTCGPNGREACLYLPDTLYDIKTNEIAGLTYTDVTGATRNVNIAVYRPDVAGGMTFPVVLMSHGGSAGKTDPMKSMEHWGPILAKAGYIAVAVAHEGRDEASYAALCETLEVNPLHPCGVKVSWDRPKDVERVLTYLFDEVPNEAPIKAMLDLEHIAHIGHSAGASAALMSVGATRNYKCALPFGFSDEDQDCQTADLVSSAFDAIDVALSMSPQGPGSEGFMTESYGAITRPFLMATGANDGDEGEPANRQALFPLLPEGNKYKLFVDDQGAKHTLFEGSTDACEPIAGLAKCEAMRTAIFSTAVAFLDAHLKTDIDAMTWLASDRILTAGQGLFSFDRR